MAHSFTDIDIPSPHAESVAETEEVVIPKRPQPTPEQARLGIIPAAIGHGTFEDIMARNRARPCLNDAEFEEFECVIAEDRDIRRDIAEERGR